MKNFIKRLFTSKTDLQLEAARKELDLTARLELELYCDYLLLLASHEYKA